MIKKIIGKTLSLKKKTGTSPFWVWKVEDHHVQVTTEAVLVKSR